MKKELFCFVFIFFTCFKALSLEVTLTQGTIKPTPIAVTDFFSNEFDMWDTYNFSNETYSIYHAISKIYILIVHFSGSFVNAILFEDFVSSIPDLTLYGLGSTLIIFRSYFLNLAD